MISWEFLLGFAVGCGGASFAWWFKTREWIEIAKSQGQGDVIRWLVNHKAERIISSFPKSFMQKPDVKFWA